jgi:basic amino acid/polyamine antiporter, APA family
MNPSSAEQTIAPAHPQLARRLGLFDATMLVMGGIIGSGIFMNPHVVALSVHSPMLIFGAWFVGGIAALIGAYIYSELAALLPAVGGQYAYLREAYHPSVAFIYGWVLLLVTQTGGMAAVAITFARYFLDLTHFPISDWVVAVSALSLLTIINCFGVRSGSTVQNVFMVLKIVAIGLLITVGFMVTNTANLNVLPVADRPVSMDLLTAFGAAMVPVLFAYGGWQTSNFVAGEIREPEKNLPRGLLLGVTGVIVLYLLVNLVCVGVLGTSGLAETKTPATQVMRIAFGETGAIIIAIGITISTLGFLSQGILTAPRVYFAMAEDKLFFKSVAWVHPKTRVPIVAIIIQGVFAILIAISGKYEQILNYVVSVDFISFGLTATTIFVFRKRFKDRISAQHFRVPGHPYTTLIFIAICWLVVLNTIIQVPQDTLIGIGIMVVGIPVYYFWQRKKNGRERTS